LRLGIGNRKLAKQVLTHVETLIAAREMNVSLDRATQVWLASIGPELRARLERAGLVDSLPRIPTLAEFVQGYLTRREQDLKPRTLDKLRDTARKLCEFFGENCPLDKITSGRAQDWVRWLRERGYAPYTIYKFLVKARGILQDAVQRELLVKNPLAGVKVQAKPEESRRVFITRQEIARLLAVLPPVWRTVVGLARYAGLRCPSEVMSLKWQHIRWESGLMTVPQPKLEHLPGKAYRVVPLFPEVRAILEEARKLAPADSEYVVWEARLRESVVTSRGWQNCNLRTALYRYLRRAGLPCWPKPFVNMRSSRQTELAEFFPEHVVAAWLGNSPTVARAHYLQSTDTHFRQAQERITALEKRTGQDESDGNAGEIERRNFTPWPESRTAQHGNERTPRIAHPCLRPENSSPQGSGTGTEVTPENRAAKSAAMPQQNPQLQETAASSKQRKNSPQVAADWDIAPSGAAWCLFAPAIALPPAGLEPAT
jgi:integrase